MRGALLAICALTALVLAAAAHAGGGRATNVVVYQPFTSAGELKASIRVDDTLSGSCFVGSLASPRRDAWRCTVANDVYDPCFSPPVQPDAPTTAISFVVCPEFGLPPRRVDRIVLDEALPADGNTGEPGATRGRPFVLSARPYAGYCSVVTGAAGTVQGRRVSYDCGRGGTLVGRIDRSRPRWTAKLLTQGDNPTLYTVRIAIAWF